MPETPASLSFEQALGELEAIVRDLEDGRLGLNDALTRYESGVGLLRQCHELLQRAQRRIEQLVGVDAQGQPERVAIDASATLDAYAARSAAAEREGAGDGAAPTTATPRGRSRRTERPAPPPTEETMDEPRGLF